MFGLMDCNNFFASCERAFNPALRNRPVVVLSNNDGCVIARSNEVKAMGIPMGTPAFKIKQLIADKKIFAFSSNYLLYGDMSRRVMALLAEQVDKMEIYSIDEAFFIVPPTDDLKSFGVNIRQYVSRSSGIPVSIGIAPTKTLAKIANHFAKKFPAYNGVCVIDTDDKRITALKMTPIDDVWGIGRRLTGRLNKLGIKTAYDFTHLPRSYVRQTMTITGERMWCELNGQSCINLEITAPDKKQICTSRSFGRMITQLDELAPAIASHAAACAAKLRAKNLCAVSIMPFVNTNRFRTDLQQCQLSQIVRLPYPTNDTRIIMQHALDALRKMYRPNFYYKKAGVIITEIISDGQKPLDLFATHDNHKSEKLMGAIDSVNEKYGRGTVRMTIELSDNKWKMHRDLLSPQYTTDINQIIDINCKK